MSGFSAAWLDLREPADEKARSRAVRDAVVEAFSAKDEVRVVDLAAGSGATLRALAPRLGPRQVWTLIDHDVALLDHARKRLAAWAETSQEAGGRLVLSLLNARVEVETAVVDLARDPLPRQADGADLVTASALFDLVGQDWLDAFVGRLAGARLPLYAALTYDGQSAFAPPHALDLPVVAAFNRHQTTDKGFGNALGPAAAGGLVKTLSKAGYDCATGESPWRLGRDDAALGAALVEGVAAAVAETDRAPSGLDQWVRFRTAAFLEGGGATVGHQDVFARARAARHLTPSNSTSKISVAFGGMTPPAPRAP